MPHLLGSRTFTLLALGVAFAALALPAASALDTAKSVRACAHARTGNLRLARKACRRGERTVTWAVRGPQGPQGATGPQGPAGASHVAIFSAQATSFVGALSPAFAGVTGITPVTAAESAAQTLAPAADFTARNLSVRTSMAPGLGNTVTVTLRDDGADTALACTVSGAATTCTSPATALVGAGSALALKVSSTPAAPAMSLLVGFEGT